MPFITFNPKKATPLHLLTLTLNQMKQIDLGGQLRITLEDFSFGTDELFYTNAVNGNVKIAIEDGVDDGDENLTFSLCHRTATI